MKSNIENKITEARSKYKRGDRIKCIIDNKYHTLHSFLFYDDFLIWGLNENRKPFVVYSFAKDKWAYKMLTALESFKRDALRLAEIPKNIKLETKNDFEIFKNIFINNVKNSLNKTTNNMNNLTAKSILTGWFEQMKKLELDSSDYDAFQHIVNQLELSEVYSSPVEMEVKKYHMDYYIKGQVMGYFKGRVLVLGSSPSELLLYDQWKLIKEKPLKFDEWYTKFRSSDGDKNENMWIGDVEEYWNEYQEYIKSLNK